MPKVGGSPCAKSRWLWVRLVLLLAFLVASCGASKDHYTVLGVDRTASDRDIKKAFHRASLKYHPDKNPGKKDANKKFSEISHAYDVLSDSSKRHLYDQYGEEGVRAGAASEGAPGGGFGSGGGGGPFTFGGGGSGKDSFFYQFATSAGPGGSSRAGAHAGPSGGFGSSGGAGGPGSFSFSFGGDGGAGGGFGGNIFETLFSAFNGGAGGAAFSSSSSHSTSSRGGAPGQGSNSRSSSSKGGGPGHGGFGGPGSYSGGGFPRGSGGGARPESPSMHAQWQHVPGAVHLRERIFKQTVEDAREAWLVVMYGHKCVECGDLAEEMRKVAKEVEGMIKVGVIDCDQERQLCSDQGGGKRLPSLKLYITAMRPTARATQRKQVPYSGRLTAGAIKKFGLENLPSVSVVLDDARFDSSFGQSSSLPQVVLFTAKSSTPPIWKAISTSFVDRAVLYEVRVPSDPSSSPVAALFRVHSTPAVIGVLPSGRRIEFAGEHALPRLAAWLEELEDLTRKEERAGAAGVPQISTLDRMTWPLVCSRETPLCVVVVPARATDVEEARDVLLAVARSPVLQRKVSGVHYAVLRRDVAYKFLMAFGVARLPQVGATVIAFKPKRKKYAVHHGGMEQKVVEDFVTRVTEGDIKLESWRLGSKSLFS